MPVLRAGRLRRTDDASRTRFVFALPDHEASTITVAPSVARDTIEEGRGRCPLRPPGCKEIHTTLKSHGKRAPRPPRYAVSHCGKSEISHNVSPFADASISPPHRRKNALSMAKSPTLSMAIDIQRAEVLLPTDRRGMTTKTNVNRTNKPSTKTGHLHRHLGPRFTQPPPIGSNSATTPWAAPRSDVRSRAHNRCFPQKTYSGR